MKEEATMYRFGKYRQRVGKTGIQLLGFLSVLFLASNLSFSAEVEVAQDFFVPIPEDHAYEAMKAIASGSPGPLNATNTMVSIIGIVIGSDNTVIYYDHWEDGYESSITAPTQTTTKIWGDNDPDNGIPPGFTNDIMNAGDIVTLTNNIPIPRNPANIFYDGKDKFSTTKPIATTRAQYGTTPGQVLAGSCQTPDTAQYGVEYILPVGTNTPSINNLSYVAVSVIAAYDPTMVDFDLNADGTNDFSIWLDQGDSYMISNVLQGATIRSNKRLMAHMLTGRRTSYYEMRWFKLTPTFQLCDTYYSPAGSRLDNTNGLHIADMYVYNHNTTSIVVNCTTLSGTVASNIPAQSLRIFSMPVDSGGKFWSSNGLAFNVIGVMDGNRNGIGSGREWGIGLLPADMLTPMIICGWGPGSGDFTQNGSPVWVTAVSNTTLLVDFDGNPDTGALTDPFGFKYDFETNVLAYESVVLYDNVNYDKDQTGTKVYTTNGVNICACWGEDPLFSAPGVPCLDMGYEILPFPSIVLSKKHLLVMDNNGNGYVDPGDSLEYYVIVKNAGWVVAHDVVVEDAVPSNTTYNANSTFTNGVSISDDNTNSPPPYTLFPLDEGGFNIGSLLPGESNVISYVFTVADPFPLTATRIANSVHGDSSQGQTETQDPEVIMKGGLSVTKTSSYPFADRVYPGSNITYTVSVLNTGQVVQTMVRVDDYLPPGISYVSNSAVVSYPGVITNTVYDQFNAVAYNNNNGTTNWLGNWTEVGDDGVVNAGNVRVANVWSANQLYAYRTGRGAYRLANLSGYTNAVLSFNYRVRNLDAGEWVAVYASSNGGSLWVELVRWTGVLNQAATQSTNLNITPYISTNTGVRFYVGAADATTEGIAVDNVQIAFSKSGIVTNAGNGTFPTLATGYSLGTNETLSVTFQARVDNPSVITQAVNTGSVISAQCPAPLTAYVTNQIAYADLRVSKTVNNTNPNTNDLITYTVAITNLGLDRATNVVVTDLIPGGITYSNSRASQGTYTNGNGIWSVGALNNGGGAIMIITGRVNNGTAAWWITNTATITASNLKDPVATNNTSSVVLVVQSVNVGVTKSVNNLTPNTNDTLTYTITFTNSSSIPATSVKVTDLLQTNSLIYSNSVPSIGTYALSNGLWNIGTIGAGSNATLIIYARVKALTENTSITNTAYISGLDQTDMYPADNTSTVISAVSGLDLGVTKTVNNNNPNTNQLITFTIAVTNYGPSTATSVQLTDLLSTNFTYSSSNLSQGAYNSVSGIWTIGTITNNKGAWLTISARPKVNTGGFDITNTASITACTQSDFNSANNSARTNLIVQHADLAVLKTVDKPMADEGANVTYTIVVTNNGPNSAGSIVISDVLATNLTYVSSAPSQGSYNNLTGLWTLSSPIISGGSETLDITAMVKYGTRLVSSTVTNRASVTGSDHQDLVSGNNSNSVTFQVVDARLAVVKTASTNGPVDFGDTITYTISVTNLGNITQTNLVISDLLPTGTVYVTDSSQVTAPLHITNTVMDRYDVVSFGNNYGTTNWLVNWDEAGTDDEIAGSGDIQMQIGNLRIGMPNNIIRRSANLLGYTNATVSFLYKREAMVAGEYVSIQASNGSGGAWTEIGQIAGAGSDVTFASTNFNLTPYISTNTAIRLLSSATFAAGHYVWFDDFKISFAGRFIQTQPGDAPSVIATNYTLYTNESLIATYQVTVEDPCSETQIVNVAEITSGQQFTPQVSTAKTSIAIADLEITKNVNTNHVGTNETIWYTITLTNNGPNRATGVEVTEYWPSNMLIFSNASPNQGTYNSTSGIWSVGTVNSGAYVSLIITGIVADIVESNEITNVVAITKTKQYDPDELNNDDSVTVVTLVILARFGAIVQGGKIVVEWETASEVNTAGFKLYRKNNKTGEFVQVTKRLLPSVPGRDQGGVYRYVDNDASAKGPLIYRLDEVETTGKVLSYGPFTVVPVPVKEKNLKAPEKEFSTEARKSTGKENRLKAKNDAEKNARQNKDGSRQKSGKALHTRAKGGKAEQMSNDDRREVIWRAILRAWTRPDMKGQTLNTELTVTIDGKGRVSVVVVSRKSGNMQFDTSLLNAAKSLKRIEGVDDPKADEDKEFIISFESDR